MKRILLITSLLSFAAQTPVQAESKILESAEAVLKGSEAVLTLPFVLADKGLEVLGKGLAYGVKTIEPGLKAIEPTITPIAKKIGNGLISTGNGLLSTGNGLVYVGTHYPATSIIALSALSVASFAKAIECEENPYKKNQAGFYLGTSMALGMASLVVFANVLVENGIQF